MICGKFALLLVSSFWYLNEGKTTNGERPRAMAMCESYMYVYDRGRPQRKHGDAPRASRSAQQGIFRASP
jgi:hypothetical protein